MNNTETYLNQLTPDNRNNIRKFFAPQNRYIIETELLDDEKLANETLPEQMEFTPNMTSKVFISIFATCSFAVLGIVFFNSLNILSYIL